jgi:hypothetical protein
MWDKIWPQFQAGKIPKPHGYITYPPYRASLALDPLNSTQMTLIVCPVGTNAQCQAIAGVGNILGCPESIQGGACPSLGKLGKQGFIEGRYFHESEDAFDGRYFYVTVMDGPMEHDYISDADHKGWYGITFDTNLWFSGQMPTNTTILKIDPANGQVVWNYTRPIYYRGGLIVTGGMVVSAWPDGKVLFNDASTGKVLRTMDLGVPLLAPFSIVPDADGNMHIMLTYGGTVHPVLGEVGFHGALGHGYMIPGSVISLSLGAAGQEGGGQVTTVVQSGASGTFSTEFYVLLAATVGLAVVVGFLVLWRYPNA